MELATVFQSILITVGLVVSGILFYYSWFRYDEIVDFTYRLNKSNPTFLHYNKFSFSWTTKLLYKLEPTLALAACTGLAITKFTDVPWSSRTIITGFFLAAFLTLIFMISLQLWFQGEDYQEEMIHLYSNKKDYLGGRQFNLWLWRSGVGLWMARFMFLIMGLMILSGIFGW